MFAYSSLLLVAFELLLMWLPAGPALKQSKNVDGMKTWIVWMDGNTTDDDAAPAASRPPAIGGWMDAF